MGETTQPWLDCPSCPACGGPCVTMATAHWNHRANPGDRLVCPACGAGCVGTDAEVAQAERAGLAWTAVKVRTREFPQTPAAHVVRRGS